jgi:osmotically-inducible protein OsmY
MALRMTRRDTYGGERGWQNGAGVSWTNPDGGGKRQWRDREPIDLDEAAEGVEDSGERQGVFNELAIKLGLRKRGPKNYERSDERIREDLCERLWHDASLDVAEVSVDVDHGIVKLDGTVPHRRMKHAIEDIAAGCAGVHDVENRIRVVRA